MVQQTLTVLIGLLGGVSVGFQTPVVNSIGQRVGSTASSAIVHISGTVLSVILLILRGGEDIRHWRTIPMWMWGAGGFGLLIMLTINYTIPRIGTGAAISLVIVGQLIVGMLIDHFGWLGVQPRPMDGYRALAGALLLFGGYLMVR